MDFEDVFFFFFWLKIYTFSMNLKRYFLYYLSQLAGAIEYTDFTSAEG